MTNNPETEVYELDSEYEMDIEEKINTYFESYGDVGSDAVLLENFSEEEIEEMIKVKIENGNYRELGYLKYKKGMDDYQVYARIIAIMCITDCKFLSNDEAEMFIQKTDELYLDGGKIKNLIDILKIINK